MCDRSEYHDDRKTNSGNRCEDWSDMQPPGQDDPKSPKDFGNPDEPAESLAYAADPRLPFSDECLLRKDRFIDTRVKKNDGRKYLAGP